MRSLERDIRDTCTWMCIIYKILEDKHESYSIGNQMTEQKAPERIYAIVNGSLRGAVWFDRPPNHFTETVEYLRADIAAAHKEEAERLRKALATISVQLPGSNESAKRIASEALAGK